MALKRGIGLTTALAMSISSILGTGIFAAPAIAYAYAGNAMLISIFLFAIFAVYIAAAFSELVCMFPTSGGIYEFAKQAFGRTPSFFVGWIGWLSGNIGNGVLITLAIDYLIPAPLIWLKIGISVAFILVLNYISYRGIEASGMAVLFFSTLSVLTIVGIAIPSFLHIQNDFTPFFNREIFGILIAAFFFSETFAGWENLTFLAGETKNPFKVLPRALIYGTIIVAVLVLLTAFFMMSVLTEAQLITSASPLTDVAKIVLPFSDKIVNDTIAIIVYLILIGTAFMSIIGLPRLLMTMSKDKLFLRGFDKISKTRNTPARAIALQTVVAIVIVLSSLGKYDFLLGILVPIVFIMYSLVMLSLFVLRIKRPHAHRPFKLIFGKAGSLVAIGVFLSLLSIWLITTEGAFGQLFFSFALILLGIPIYFILELYYDVRFSVFVNDILAHTYVFFENILFPKKIRKQILDKIGNPEGLRLLEYGCGVGTLTEFLAKEIENKGKIYATDTSHHAIEITKKRLQKLRKLKPGSVSFFIDMPNRIRPEIPDIDVAISAGDISNLTDVGIFLKDLNARLDKTDRLIIMDYTKFFKIVSNVPWLRNDASIKRIFNQHGFSIMVERHKGVLLDYVVISGKKVREL